jgi:hypothetical protein
MSTLTSRDGRDFIIRALDGREADYDVDAIVDACHAAADGWDFETIPDGEFWDIVADHDTSAHPANPLSAALAALRAFAAEKNDAELAEQVERVAEVLSRPGV